jgi:hypothetical protein
MKQVKHGLETLAKFQHQLNSSTGQGEIISATVQAENT